MLRYTLISIIIIYIVFFVYKTDSSEKISIMHTFKNMSHIPCDYLQTLKLFLFPFQDSNYITKYTGGSLYNHYLYSKNADLMKRLQNRMFWIYTLNKHKIPQPEIIASCDGNHCNIYQDYVDTTRYIEHTNTSTKKIVHGREIHLVPGSNKVWTEMKEYKNEFFTVVTLPYSVFRIHSSDRQNNQGEVISWGQGLTKNNCHTNKDFDDLSKYNNLLKLIQKLQDLHKNEFSNVFSLTWEISINTDDSYHVTKTFMKPLHEVSQETLEDFRKEWNKFPKE